MKITKETRYNAKPFTKLHIGDPMYFEKIAEGSDNESLKEITFDDTIRCVKFASVKIEEVEDSFNHDGKDVPCTTIRVTIGAGSTEAIVNTYMEGKYYSYKLKKKYKLGCDTARFEIETKHGYDEFHTGADGFYGDLLLMKEYFGCFLSLDLDGDLFEFDEVVKRFKHLFPEK